MKKYFLLIFTVMLWIFHIHSVPINPKLKDELMKKGKEIPNEPKVEEVELFEDEDSSINNIQSTKPKTVMTEGQQRVLVLLVDFEDNTHNSEYTKQDFDNMLFSDDTYTTGSFRDYYQDVSYGTYDVVGPVAYDWYQINAHDYSYYTNNNYGTGSYPKNAQRLVRDLVYELDSEIDYSKYDTNNDGEVDHLIVIHAGKGAESTGDTSDIWSHKWSTYDWDDKDGDGDVDNDEISVINLDGVNIIDYCIQPELNYDGNLIEIGVFTHEFGHMLGLPDLYDTEDPSQDDDPNEGIGNYGLMAGGSYGGDGYHAEKPVFMSAWCRIQLGWTQPTEIKDSNTGEKSLPKVSANSSDTVYKVWKDGDYTGSEYFLVENRYTGTNEWDKYLPRGGLAIWHINETNPDNNDPSNLMVALEQADGNFDLENNNNRADDGDLYPGSTYSTVFDKDTTPSSNSNSGNITNVSIFNISKSSETMTANIALTALSNFSIDSVSDCIKSNPIDVSWSSAGDGASYDVKTSLNGGNWTTQGTTTNLSMSITPDTVGKWELKVIASKNGKEKSSSNTVEFQCSTVEDFSSGPDVVRSENTSDTFLIYNDGLNISWSDSNDDSVYDYDYAITTTSETPSSFSDTGSGGSDSFAITSSNENYPSNGGTYWMHIKCVNESDSEDYKVFSTSFNLVEFQPVILPNMINDNNISVLVAGKGLSASDKTLNDLLYIKNGDTRYEDLRANSAGNFYTQTDFNTEEFSSTTTFDLYCHHSKLTEDEQINISDGSLTYEITNINNNPYAVDRRIKLLTNKDKEVSIIRINYPELAGLKETEGEIYYIGKVEKESIGYEPSEGYKLQKWNGNSWQDTLKVDESGYYSVVSGNIVPKVNQTKLNQNYPNPFNPETNIPITVEKEGHVKLTIYNSNGKKVRVLLDKYISSPVENKPIHWNGKDSRGRDVSSGVYYAVLEVNGKRYMKKMVMLK